MEGNNVIYAAERFMQRSDQPGETAPNSNAIVYYLDDYRTENEKMIETIVKQSAAGIAVILDSNGYKVEGDQVLEKARQLARQGIPAREIYEIFNQYLKDSHPALHRVYRL